MNTFYPRLSGMCWAFVTDHSSITNGAFSDSWQVGFSFNVNGSRCFQIAFNAQSNTSPKSRILNPNTHEWSEWTEI